MVKIIIPVIICFWLSYTGYNNFFKEGLPDQQTHQTMTELGLLNLENSGVIWYGTYSYFNDKYVIDLLYKTRDCKGIKNRNEFYPGHNKYDYLIDTGLTYYIGKLWKPNESEKKILNKYKVSKFKDVLIFQK